MKNEIVILALVLAGVAGCDQGEELPPPVDIDAMPTVVPKPAQGNNAISVALKHYIVTTDERLKEHVIQVAGLKFMSESNPSGASAELQEITVWLEDSLTSAQKILGNLRVASADRVETMKADLETLISKMDERYEVAVGLAQGAYENTVDIESLGNDQEGDLQTEDWQDEAPDFEGDGFEDVPEAFK